MLNWFYNWVQLINIKRQIKKGCSRVIVEFNTTTVPLNYVNDFIESLKEKFNVSTIVDGDKQATIITVTSK